jgi:hypothetical protein
VRAQNGIQMETSFTETPRICLGNGASGSRMTDQSSFFGEVLILELNRFVNSGFQNFRGWLCWP